MGSATISVDEFQALEQKVLQAVELIRKEREARSAAEHELNAVRTELTEAQNKLASTENELQAVRGELSAAQTEATELRDKVATAAVAQSEVESLQREREAVRLRVEKMLSQMDELL